MQHATVPLYLFTDNNSCLLHIPTDVNSETMPVALVSFCLVACEICLYWEHSSLTFVNSSCS